MFSSDTSLVSSQGWFGRPDKTGGGVNHTKTEAIWAAIASARKAVETIYHAPVASSSASAPAPAVAPALAPALASLQAEIAVFTDDVALGHLRANGVGTIDATIHPAEWLNDLQVYTGQVGAPVRYFHLRDLLLPSTQMASALSGIKLAIFPNAFVQSEELRTVIAQLQSHNRTNCNINAILFLNFLLKMQR